MRIADGAKVAKMTFTAREDDEEEAVAENEVAEAQAEAPTALAPEDIPTTSPKADAENE